MEHQSQDGPRASGEVLAVPRAVTGWTSLQVRLVLAGTPVIWLVVATLLWDDTSHGALLLWGALLVVSLSCGLPLIGLAREEEVEPDRWMRGVYLAQFSAALGYASLPWIAMPASPESKAMVCAVAVAILAANVLLSDASRRGRFVFFSVFLIIETSAFLVRATNFKFESLLLIGFAGLFTYGLGEIHRAATSHTAALASWNRGITLRLREEQSRLRRANQLLALRANHDQLTGLANRGEVMRHLEDAIGRNQSSPRRAGVIFFDFDHFKAINDSYGHSVGDELLVAASKRLAGLVGDSALLGRFGGDEMIVSIPNVAGIEDVRQLANRMNAALQQPFVIGKTSLHVYASLGVAVTLRGSQSADDLLRCADAALYEAKRRGRGRVVVFDASMEDELIHSATAADDLRAALEAGDIVPYFQPIVDLATGRIIGAEALARWRHWSGVRVASAFIPLAVQIGLHRPIARLMVDRIEGSLRRWTEAVPDMRVTINIPTDWLEELVAQLSDRATDLRGLVIEITDVGPIDNVSRLAHLLARARLAGAEIWLDDFGVGNSPMVRLAELPLDGVKLHGQITQDVRTNPATRAIVAASVELGSRLGLQIVAEGVETIEQARELWSLGVPTGQGFAFTPAVEASEFETMLFGAKVWPIHDVPPADLATLRCDADGAEVMPQPSPAVPAVPWAHHGQAASESHGVPDSVTEVQSARSSLIARPSRSATA